MCTTREILHARRSEIDGEIRFSIGAYSGGNFNENSARFLRFTKCSVGDDPRYVPCEVFPAFIIRWAGFGSISSRTNDPGLFAAGRCDYSIHGANRLGANSLVGYGGFVAAKSALITRKRRA